MENFRINRRNYCGVCKCPEKKYKILPVLKTDGSTKPSADIDFDGHNVKNLKAPTNDNDGATRSYIKGKLKRIGYNSVIQSTKTKSISTASNPNWTMLLIVVSYFDYYIPFIVFRDEIDENFTFSMNGDGDPTNVEYRYHYYGSFNITEATSQKVTIKVNKFYYYDEEDKKYFEKTGNNKYGILSVKII
ncbi:035R [Cherax quadricarinatus iridovirus]|uniref:Uncharacterized protein n=1 Tax=Shrimp hemocyte iridescent virus TaxID=2039780 RepID=A0A291B0V2_9VIRU|nr:035R [Cherax quadricarinatus iridovirus]YP_010084868.1 hypothetical protein KM509_gp116 [Shrimp hemocyte iridescent virus]UPA43354.1 hypothetical protein 4TH000080 [Iridovirus CN01]ASZ85015.1 035R [Cherax quadricarinatus iridovirus]ATE87125.1 hypothetical protein [Shrimp hemocyte iridescent virus]UPA43589.1 hypothetical protein 3TG000156 [Iridovirus CN01]UPA43624.1 hypothetical protein 1DG000032 [Iridovirus CN01]